MSNHHIEMLAHLANAEYALNQIHSRSKVHDGSGIPLTEHMTNARNLITSSHTKDLNEEYPEALTNLRSANEITKHIVDNLSSIIGQQVDSYYNKENKISYPNLQSNMKDAVGVMDNITNFMNTATGYTKHVMENKVPSYLEKKANERKAAVDNAREVIDSIADEHNIILPDGWDNGRGTPPPNKE